MNKTIIYIHGVGGENSSKFKKIKEYFVNHNVESINQDKLISKTLKVIDERIRNSNNEKFTLIGSSRGGLIALYIGYQYDIPIIAINPALTMSNINFDPDNKEILEMMSKIVKEDNEDIDNSRLTNLFLGSKDEIIDYKEAKGLNCSFISIRETNHKYDDFDVILPTINSIISNKYSDESDMINSII